MRVRYKPVPGLASLVVCILAAPTMLHAKNVTLYGVADGGIGFLRNGAGGTVTAVTSGLNTGSRWGIRGSEDLGGGLQAMFHFESGFELDTGDAKRFSGNPGSATPSAPNGTPGTGFNRRAYVGLNSARWGSLSFGRDYTPLYFAALDSDAFRLGLFGNLQALTQPAGGAERFARVSNGLFYVSSQVGGFTGRLAYSFGSESSGAANGPPRHANEFAALGLQYAQGPLVLTASYQVLKAPGVAGNPPAFTGENLHRKDGLLGASYRVGQMRFVAGFWKMGAPQHADNKWIGASMPLGTGTVIAQVQRMSQQVDAGQKQKGTLLGVGYIHPLSKRTALYASYGRTRNNAVGGFSVTSSDFAVAPAVRGSNPSALGLGVRHDF